MADYSINAVTRRVVYTGSAGTGPYAFSFEILATTDVAVYKNSTKLTLTTDYTVTINANGTGSVTLVSAATGSDRITIIGARAISRTTDFVTAGDLLAVSLNEQLDANIIMTQQLAEENRRTLKAPPYDPASTEDGGTLDMTLPVAATRAGKVLAFNATTGNPEAGPSIAAVQTVANASADIDTVAGSISNVNTVATNIANVNTVAGVSGNVTTVAGISANVTTVAGNSANVTTVAGSISNVNTAATNIASINTAAANIADIQNAEENATAAAASASLANDWATKTSGAVAGGEYSAKYHAQAAASSASSAASAQTAAETARDQTLSAFDNFDDRYLGTKSSDPTLDNDGNALVGGALYFNSVDGVMKVYTGSAWVAAYASLSGALLVANNLSDLASTSSARTNLGLGTAATMSGPSGAIVGTTDTQTLTNKTISGGTINGAPIGGTTAAAGSFTTLSASTSLTSPVLKNPSSASNNISLDANGNATVAGTLVAGSSMGWRNRLINSDFRIDQRNAGATTTMPGYIVDRWQYGAAGVGSVSQGRSTVAPAGFTNSYGMTVTSAGTVNGSTFHQLLQKVEGNNVADFAFGTSSAQTVTFSFWVRSSLTGTFCASFHNSAVNRSLVREYTISAANTWEYKTLTIPGDTTGTWLTDNGIGLYVIFTVADGLTKASSTNAWTAGSFYATSNQTQLTQTSGATFNVTGVQLEVGTVATPFERRDFGRELAMCQRYFQQIGSGFSGMEENTSYFSIQAPYQTPMRVAPTLSLISTSIATRIPAISTDRSIPGCVISDAAGTTYSVWVGLSCSGGNVSGRFIQNRNGSNIINANAEL